MQDRESATPTYGPVDIATLQALGALGSSGCVGKQN